ncbi:Glyoxalase/Bleomycin resistance protein/Dihydroxybiphenyl dioxygenase [Hypomontagnella monticulosa]|nr:Glyoxalase/Bleomycin resistance protein/Dihydroxybiphenyl dioxygenase [Hypomontagnella monticulosa]
MAEGKPSGKVLSPSRLAHVVLRTARFRPMIEWYNAVLGAHAVVETPNLAFLTYDDEHHRIAIAGIPTCSDKVRNSAGLEHIAFTFDKMTDLADTYLQRKARGIVPIWCVNHGPTTSMYYQDPDGNMVEMQVDNFETADEATAYMTGPEMVENPFGVDFDPEDLVRRLKSGESEDEIKKRPSIGPRGFDSLPILNPPAPIVKDSYEPLGIAA